MIVETAVEKCAEDKNDGYPNIVNSSEEVLDLLGYFRDIEPGKEEDEENIEVIVALIEQLGEIVFSLAEEDPSIIAGYDFDVLLRNLELAQEGHAVVELLEASDEIVDTLLEIIKFAEQKA